MKSYPDISGIILVIEEEWTYDLPLLLRLTLNSCPGLKCNSRSAVQIGLICSY